MMHDSKSWGISGVSKVQGNCIWGYSCLNFLLPELASKWKVEEIWIGLVPHPLPKLILTLGGMFLIFYRANIPRGLFSPKRALIDPMFGQSNKTSLPNGRQHVNVLLCSSFPEGVGVFIWYLCVCGWFKALCICPPSPPAPLQCSPSCLS